MAGRITRLLLIAGLLGSAQAPAQEGHPFDGTWRGTLTDEQGETQRVLLILDYDGEQIGGMINPGPKSLRVQAAELDAPNWQLSLRAEAADGPIEMVATLHEIGSPRRYMEGSWKQGGKDYQLRVTRE